MKYSTRLSDAVHILAFIALNPNGSLSSSSIAESIHTNPGCVTGQWKVKNLCCIWILIPIRNAASEFIFSCLFRIFLIRSRSRQKKR